MERKVGEIFTYKGKTYEVVQSRETCIGCAFRGIPCKVSKLIKGGCSSYYRSDNISIIFKEINNMEIKNNQLTIDIPEGMNIDIENSDLAKGIIKFKSKYITYDDIENTLHLKETCIGITTDVNNIDKLTAINELMNIAKYYNKDWKPNWNNNKEKKYLIKFDNYNPEFFVDVNLTTNLGNVYFKNLEDTQSVIDNPNFREILDAIYKY